MRRACEIRTAGSWNAATAIDRVVLDAGTMEHCFNVGQTIRNIVDMTKVGGFVIHLNPMTMINHGFFNYHPRFFHSLSGIQSLWHTRLENESRVDLRNR